jgi:hypothetical protein
MVSGVPGRNYGVVYNVLLTILGFILPKRRPMLGLLPCACNSKASPSPLRRRLPNLLLSSGRWLLRTGQFRGHCSAYSALLKLLSQVKFCNVANRNFKSRSRALYCGEHFESFTVKK